MAERERQAQRALVRATQRGRERERPERADLQRKRHQLATM